MRKITIIDAQNIASSRKGECLSTTYINNYTKLKWKCLKGHIWEAHFNSVSSNGSWCPLCKPIFVKVPIDDLHELAAKNQGFFLDTVYNGTNFEHNWKCNKGHVWKDSRSAIKRGKWCPVCPTPEKKPHMIEYELISNKENIREIRRQNILFLILQYKSMNKLASALKKSSGRVRQMREGFIGDKVSRDIEKTLNLPDNYMDKFHGKLILN